MTTAEKLLHSLFSPPRPIHESKDNEPKDEDHNKNSAETGISSAANRQNELRSVKEDRCRFTFSDGRQCRNESASLCPHHSSRKRRDSGAEGAPDAALEGLVGLCGDLTTSTNINRALSQVFLLMAQGRISQKQAVAFGYISQLLLQTVPGIRSEYVSVHGYRDWENRLKTSLTQNTNEAPDPSPGGGGEEQERSRDTNEQPINGVVDHPARMVVPSEQRKRGAASPDYADIFRRSRAMMAGKYDTTPEGRREANALALELELMNPAPAKPRKDFFGRTVALVRRLREHQTKKFGAASQPPSAPAPFPTAPMPSSVVSAPSKTEAAQSAASPPATHGAELCSSGRGATGVPEARRPCAPWGGEPALRPSDQSPVPRPKQEMPVPGITLARTGHTTAWYAPASWSGRQPDLYPSRKEKLRYSLRVASDRRRQHQMQNRAFWR